MSNNQSSVQSYVDSATGTVQNALDSITGNKQDKTGVDHGKANASGLSVSGPAAGAKNDESDRSDGKWNQTLGSAKETAGGLVGSENLKEQGRSQNLEGQQQEAQGQVQDYGSGAGDRVTGAVGNAIAGLTGDHEKQQKYMDQHDEGKALQKDVEHDVQKKVDAQGKAA